MAFTHGKDSVFTFDTVALTSFITDVSLDRSAEMAETTTMAAEAKTYISGLTDATISVSGRWDSTTTTGPDENLNTWLGEEAASAFEFGPEGSANGKVKYSGNAYCTSYNTSAPVGDVVAFTAEFQITGAVTRGTYSA